MAYNYNNQPQQETKRLWHYTSKEGAQGIREDGYIQQSTRKGDCQYGEGTYLTSKHPHYNSRSGMAKNNYDDGKSSWSKFRDQGKCDYAVEVHVPVENLSKVQGRNVYKFDGPVDVDEYGSGRVLKTQKKYS